MPPAKQPTDLLHWRVAFVIFFTVLTVLTHLPRSNPLGAEHRPPDKLLHFAAFGLAALLLVRTRWMPMSVALVVMALWIPLDEWTQGMVSAHRMTEAADITSGIMGVLAVGMLALACRPPRNSIDAGRRYNACFDLITQPGHGGLRALLCGAAVGGGVLTGVYLALFKANDPWPGTIAMLLGMMSGTATCALLLRHSWRKASGPRLPSVGLHWWVAAVLGGCAGFMVGAGMGEYGLPSLGTPTGLFTGVTIFCAGLRRSFRLACRCASADVTSTDG